MLQDGLVLIWLDGVEEEAFIDRKAYTCFDAVWEAIYEHEQDWVKHWSWENVKTL